MGKKSGQNHVDLVLKVAVLLYIPMFDGNVFNLLRCFFLSFMSRSSFFFFLMLSILKGEYSGVIIPSGVNPTNNHDLLQLIEINGG